MGKRKLFLLVSSSLVTLFAGVATAGILHATNNGVDGAACGSEVKPCRSISRAIANAQSGDTILVGPGLYGDINRDNDFADPGEEAAEPVEPGRGCVVCISKPVRIISSHGAAATRIESRSNLFNNADSGLYALVLVDATGVTFGTPGHGFELGGAPFSMVRVIQGNANVGGNVVRRVETPRRDFELPSLVGFIVAASGGTVTLTGNTAAGNHVGYSLGGAAPLALTGNVATGNTWEGFITTGSGTKTLIGNYASENGAGPPGENPETGVPIFPSATGFNFREGNTVAEDNISVGNYGPGFVVRASAANVRLENNAATGNAGPGVLASAFSVLNVKYNNIFGNLGVYGNPGTATGCGLINDSGKAVNGARNFWGAASGPGADPADKAGPGSGCDIGAGSGTRLDPISTEPQPVVPPN